MPLIEKKKFINKILKLREQQDRPIIIIKIFNVESTKTPKPDKS